MKNKGLFSQYTHSYTRNQAGKQDELTTCTAGTFFHYAAGIAIPMA
jgi:hypothetical protein